MKKAKRFLSVLLTLCMVLGMMPGAAFAAKNSAAFSDVDAAAWYAGAVEYAYENGMMSGTGEGTFSPDAATTRGMIVTILHKMEGTPKAKGQSFDDVTKDQYFAGAVAWASANGIVSGYGNGKFGPNDVITREQLAVILYGYAQLKGYDVSVGEDTNILSYNDIDHLAEWAIPAMQWACGAGLISGMGEGLLNPKGNATRAQAAMILMKFCEGAEDETETYTVTFEYNYGKMGTYKTKEVPAGENVGHPGMVDRTGYDFKGWYTKAEGGKKFDFGTAITEDLTLYAHWSKSKGGSSASISLESAGIARAGQNVAGVSLKSGDELSVYVVPADATYTVKWMAGGQQVASTQTYTVSAMDAGQTITAEVTGTGSYSGTLTTQATGAVVASLNVYELSADTSPVAVDAENTVFKTADGSEVDVSSTALDYRVETNTDADAVDESTSSDLKVAIAEVVEGVDTEDMDDVPVNYVAVDADLIMVTEENGETTETAVHPVGETTVTLSKENLGVPADADLTQYVFFANHTNVDDEEENVPGEVVTVGGVQYVRFVLNGLSRIYIGNVPPLTVTFNTDGGSEVPAQKVKLGGYAVDVEPPVKAGWLFAGWDHDIQTENIIKDITVTARWIQGTTAADNQLSGMWKQNGEETTQPENVQKTIANGVVTLVLDSEEEYAANLSYELFVAPVEGAVKMATATTAEGAMAAGEEDYEDAVAVGVPAVVTTETGTIKTSNTNKYIKWVAEDGTVLGLQSARLVVRTLNSAPGNYDTQTRVETADVDRGLGQMEFYLTNGKDENGNAIPDYAGVINGYLNSRWTNNEEIYYLNLYGSFYESFWNDGERYDGGNYSGVKVVIKPFEGESFAAVPTVNAYYDEEGTNDSVDYTSAITTKLENGNIVLTCAKPASDAEYVYLYLDLELNGVSQSISIDIDNYNGSSEYTTLHTESWSEALAALKSGTQRVYYRGSQSVTLNTALTLKPDQHLYFNNYDNQVSLTIGNGGVLTVEGDNLNGAGVYVWNGKVIVANGGVLTTNSQDPEQDRYYNVGVRPEYGLTIQNGGQLKVPTYGYMRVYNGMGGFNLEQGGQVKVAQRLYMDRDSQSVEDSVLAGTVTVTNDNGYLEFNDGLTIASTGSVTISDRSRFYVYGGLIVNEGGQVTCNGRRVSLSGRSENYGTITMNAGTLEMWNTGYSVYNNGTIYVDADVSMNIKGTVLVNTGSLTGSGKLYANEMNDTSSYDNGIEYVEVEEISDRTPANYDRYQFVKDPAATVDVIYFIGELSNQNGGTSTLTERN